MSSDWDDCKFKHGDIVIHRAATRDHLRDQQKFIITMVRLDKCPAGTVQRSYHGRCYAGQTAYGNGNPHMTHDFQECEIELAPAPADD